MIFIINEPNPYERYQLNFLVMYSINFFYFRICDIDFNALSNNIYNKFWRITFLYAFLQHKCQPSQYDIYN